MPPEMVGFSTAIRIVWPIVVSALTTCTVLLVRSADRLGGSTVSAAIRGSIGIMLVALLVYQWVRVRDRMRRKIRAFMDEGRSYQSQQRSSA
jgi:hypothetical protein